MAKLIIDNETRGFVDKVQGLINKGQFRTQLEIAKLIRMSPPGLCAIMKGKRNAPVYSIYRLNELISKGNLKVELNIKTYSLDQIMEALKAELKDGYGGLSKDAEGRELQTPYMVIGIVTAAFDRLK